MSHSRRARGFALFVVLLAILLILSAGALIAIHLQGRHLLVRDQVRDVHVQNLLDSGIAHGMAKVYDDIAHSGVDRLKIDGGEAVVEVSIAGPERSWVDVWARYQGETRSLRVQLHVEEQGAHPRVVEWGDVPPGESPFDDRLDDALD